MEQLFNYIRNGQVMLKNIVNAKELSIYKDGIYERWDKLGFTEGLDEHGSIILSNAFEDMSQYLLTHGEDEYEVAYFVILKRLYTKFNITLPSIQLVHFIKNNLAILEKHFKDKGSYDPLAEACVEIVNMIGRYFK